MPRTARTTGKTSYEGQEGTAVSGIAEGLRGALPASAAAPGPRPGGVRQRGGGHRRDGLVAGGLHGRSTGLLRPAQRIARGLRSGAPALAQGGGEGSTETSARRIRDVGRRSVAAPGWEPEPRGHDSQGRPKSNRGSHPQTGRPLPRQPGTLHLKHTAEAMGQGTATRSGNGLRKRFPILETRAVECLHPPRDLGGLPRAEIGPVRWGEYGPRGLLSRPRIFGNSIHRTVR